jgi:hypothetical protein
MCKQWLGQSRKQPPEEISIFSTPQNSHISTLCKKLTHHQLRAHVERREAGNEMGWFVNDLTQGPGGTLQGGRLVQRVIMGNVCNVPDQNVHRPPYALLAKILQSILSYMNLASIPMTSITLAATS